MLLTEKQSVLTVLIADASVQAHTGCHEVSSISRCAQLAGVSPAKFGVHA